MLEAVFHGNRDIQPDGDSDHAQRDQFGCLSPWRASSRCPIADLGDAWSHSDRFLWVGLYEPSEQVLAHIQQAFGLHDLAIEDAHRAHQRPNGGLR